MMHIAVRMLAASRAKFAGLLFGLAFTSFLVTFAAGFLAGFLTNGYALISENAGVDVWVMDPAVVSTESVTGMLPSALNRVRSVDGVAQAYPLWLTHADMRLANGAFQSVQVIAVDDAALAGAPMGLAALRGPGSAIVDAGGTEGKLLTPSLPRDTWPYDGAHLGVPARELSAGDAVQINDHRVAIIARSSTLPRFPPRPLLFMTRGNALTLLPAESRSVTFVLVRGAHGLDPRALARRIEQRTGLRARAREDFKVDTVKWYLLNSEDVGDITAMLVLAMTMGLGVSGIMLYMFTYESRRDFGVLKAMGMPRAKLIRLVLLQTAVSVALGGAIGLGLAGIAAIIAGANGFPVRLVAATPFAGIGGVCLVGAIAAGLSLRPVLKLDPSTLFVSH